MSPKIFVKMMLSFARFIWNFHNADEAPSDIRTYDNTTTLTDKFWRAFSIKEYPPSEDKDIKNQRFALHALFESAETHKNYHNDTIYVSFRTIPRSMEDKSEEEVLKQKQKNGFHHFAFVIDTSLQTDISAHETMLHGAAEALSHWLRDQSRPQVHTPEPNVLYNPKNKV
jgi:hypothetical protein